MVKDQNACNGKVSKIMFFGLMTLVVALCISAVAAYYSIVGLMAIFSASAVSIAIMGVVLEIGKLVTASWLYQNWTTVPKVLKYYLTSAVIVLMFITSMGIFGYLSKSHIDAGSNTSQAQIKIDRIDNYIKSEEKTIIRAEKQLQSLDDALDRYIELGAVSKGLNKREEQQEERDKLTNMVNKSQTRIDELLDQKSVYDLEIKNFEVEVGPLKYISALLYGDDALTFLENAVRWVILILVFVFDPLAVLLVIAANITIKQELTRIKREKDKALRKQRKGKVKVQVEEVENGMRKVVKEKNGVTMEYYE